MRFCTYRRDGQDRTGLVGGDRVFGMAPGVTLLGLLGDDGERLHEAGEVARRDPVEELVLRDLALRAPVPVPPSIRDFLAFEDHLRTARGSVDPEWYELPIFYFSNPQAVLGPRDDVPVAPGSLEWDYELEMAAIVGRAGSDLHPDTAERHIAGYTILCDFSARDLQRREMRLGLGPAKGKDTATSMGPVLVTADELEVHRSGRGFGLETSVSVNGTRLGGGRLDDLYWSFGDMLAYASRGTTVVPGDVIGSGTVGTGCLLELKSLGRDVPWLAPGDEVEVSVDRIGTMLHRITEGRDPIPLPPRATG